MLACSSKYSKDPSVNKNGLKFVDLLKFNFKNLVTPRYMSILENFQGGFKLGLLSG